MIVRLIQNRRKYSYLSYPRSNRNQTCLIMTDGWSPPKNAKIWGHLFNEVVRANHCMMCGACVASCPINVLNVNVNEEPVIKGPCAACQVCYYSCPRLELPIDEIEYFLFARTRKPEEESLGIYKNIYSARALDEEVWHAGQDGGTVIALMTHALQIGLINCFATSDFTKSNSAFVLGNGMVLKTVPVVGDTAADLIRTAGSKYTHGGVLGVLSDAAASYPDARVGLVALPCELQGLWRMHTATQATVKFSGSWIRGGRPVLTIGLFCSKVYTHDKLVTDFIQKQHGIDPSKITRTVIKRNRFKVYIGADMVLDVPTKDLEQYVSHPCHYCIDYVAELADISVGAVGSPDGWTTVIVRSELGQKLFDSAVKARAIEAAPVDQSKNGLPFVVKLCNKKKRTNNPYYIRRGLREGFLEHRRNDLLQIAPAPEAK
jgi:coenzyme F420 hydrogenase subunit beta